MRKSTCVLLLLAACGGSATAPNDDVPTSNRPTDVEGTLAALGVSLDPPPAVDASDRALPDSYRPLGTSPVIDKLDELFVYGYALGGPLEGRGPLSVVKTPPLRDGRVFVEPLHVGDLAAGVRPLDALRGDIDDDGREEVVLLVANDAGAIGVDVVEDQEDGFRQHRLRTLDEVTGAGRAFALLDSDADGQMELAAAWSSGETVRLVIVPLNGGPPLFSATREATRPASDKQVRLVHGNFDHDPGEELVVIVNEVFEQDSRISGESRLSVLDDAEGDWQWRIDAERVRVSSDGAPLTARVLDAAAGDVDGDGVDELVLGGLPSFVPAEPCAFEVLLAVKDDALTDFAPFGGSDSASQVVRRTTSLAGRCASENPLQLRFVEVETADLDDDGRAEVFAEGWVFDDFTQQAFVPMEDAEISAELLYPRNAEGQFFGLVEASSRQFRIGDLNHDKRQDVIVSTPASGGIRIFGLSDIYGFSEIGHLAGQPNPPDGAVPLVLPVNVNRDTLALKYSEAERSLVFTEPVVLAAIATPPCDASLGQDISQCRTAYTNGTSTTIERADSWSVEVGPKIGFKTEFGKGPIKLEVEATLGVVYRHAQKTSASRRVRTLITVTTGPNEDGVLFTTVPYDRYVYRILSHPNPNLVGEQIELVNPRKPIQAMVERSFYNANVEEGGYLVDDRIFGHVAGAIDSYKVAADKDALLAQFEGFEAGPFDVGQGGGFTTARLDVFDQTSMSVRNGFGIKVDIKTTKAGFIRGLTVGHNRDASIRTTRGRLTRYTGSIAHMDDAGFVEHPYSVGLFTYALLEGQYPIDVVDYWVER